MMDEHKRIYGKAPDIMPGELRDAFAAITWIRLAVLFGSRARADKAAAGSRSDYDFAVLLDKTTLAGWGHLAKARVEIGQALRLSDCDFDLVDLEVAPQGIKQCIKEHHILLKGSADELYRLLG